MDYKENLKNFIDIHGNLKQYPTKKKYKMLALLFLGTSFEKGVSYTEKQVNAILNLKHTFEDPALLRRELFENKILNRKSDCSEYWLNDEQPTPQQLGLSEEDLK